MGEHRPSHPPTNLRSNTTNDSLRLLQRIIHQELTERQISHEQGRLLATTPHGEQSEIDYPTVVTSSTSNLIRHSTDIYQQVNYQPYKQTVQSLYRRNYGD